jgi:hypothetical protein
VGTAFTVGVRRQLRRVLGHQEGLRPRVEEHEERYGLDIVEHGMWGYPSVHACPGIGVPSPGDADGMATAPAGTRSRTPMASDQVQEG